MIYVLIDVEFGYHAEYCGSEILVGPKMDIEKLHSLMKKYFKEFEFIFQQIYDYFVEKYTMEIYAEHDKDMRYVDYDSEYYIDCEVHAMLEHILGFSDDQHMRWRGYCDMYIHKMLHENHGFEKDPEYVKSFEDLSFCECCC